MEKEHLEIIYDEIVEIHKHQQEAVDLIYNKLNWILVSDFVFLAAIFNFHWRSKIVILLVCISIVATLVIIGHHKFKATAKISKMLEKKDNPKFLEDLIVVKVKAFNKNESEITKIEKHLTWSRYSLIFAVVLQFLLIIFKN